MARELLERTKELLGVQVLSIQPLSTFKADKDPSLAWAELYLTFAHVFRRYDLALDPSRSVV